MSNGTWTNIENDLIAADCFAMLADDVSGRPYNKAEHRRALLIDIDGMGDIGSLAEAKKLGLDAHTLTPVDFRPCTLIGAVSMELGNLAAGHDWFPLS